MPHLIRTRADILSNILSNLTANTPITNTAPGSIARAFAEAFSSQLGDFYGILNFNLTTQLASTAAGTELDLIGAIYNTPRKNLSNIATQLATSNVFYFYLTAPYSSDITIPSGTGISTDPNNQMGMLYSYFTTTNAVIGAGRTKAYVGLKPANTDSVFAVGPNMLVVNDFVAPVGVTVKCTNPKSISPVVGMEADSDYRARILTAVRTTAGGTATAIRFAGLAVPGVRDVTVLQGAFGLGTYRALVVPEDPTSALVAVAAATQAIMEVTPVGVRFYIDQPFYLPVDVSASIVISSAAANTGQALANQVQNTITNFLTESLVGTPLVYYQMIQAILDTDASITDVQITNFAVNGNQVLRQNYTPGIDEQLTPGSIIVSFQIGS